MAYKYTDAVQYLTRRWEEQVERYPLMHKEIPLQLYLQRNVRYLLTWRNRQMRALEE